MALKGVAQGRWAGTPGLSGAGRKTEITTRRAMSAPVISTSGAKRRCGWERAIHSRLRRLVEARGAPPRALRRPRIHTLTPGSHGGPLQSGLLRRPRSDTAIVLHVLKEAIGSLNACDGEGRGPHNWCYICTSYIIACNTIRSLYFDICLLSLDQTFRVRSLSLSNVDHRVFERSPLSRRYSPNWKR